MQFTDSFATEQRLSILDCFQFCQQHSENLQYRPNNYRQDLELANNAAEYLHQLMNYQDHQSEY